jgi:hypothetical protein
MEMSAELQKFKEKLENQIISGLAHNTFEGIKTDATDHLSGSRLDTYLEALSVYKDGNVWVVELNEKANWLEEGQKPHDMLDYLLKSPKVKTSKSGNKYLTIPMKKGESTAGPKGKPNAGASLDQTLMKDLKAGLRKEKIPFKKIEKDAGGNPKIGTLHRLDIASTVQNRVSNNKEGSGTPLLHRVSVSQQYAKHTKGQKKGEVKTHKGKPVVNKVFTTFRTASESQRGTGLWHHKGTEGLKLFENAYEEALRKLETEIIPALLKSIE